MIRLSLLVLASFLFAGCANNRMAIEGPSTGEYMAALPLMEYQESAPTGSIFTDSRRSRAFGYRKNFAIGDILTVVLGESTQAQRSSGINLSKEVSNAPLSQIQPAFFNSPDIATSPGFMNRYKRVLKNLTFTEQNRSDKGVGTADQAASLSGAVAVIVTKVLDNGNLFVEGKKVLALSEGSEEVFISGIITPKDVQPDNTILSSRIAQASIVYRGRGDVADVATASWGSRLFNKLWPF